MVTRRERVLELASQINAMKAELSKLETELDLLLSGGGGNEANARVPEPSVSRSWLRRSAHHDGPPETTLLGGPTLGQIASQSIGPDDVQSLRHRVLGVFESNRQFAFDAKLLAEALKVELTTMRTILSRLHRSHDIVKLRPGLYRAKRPGEIVAPPEGSDDPDAEEDA